MSCIGVVTSHWLTAVGRQSQRAQGCVQQVKFLFKKFKRNNHT